MKSIVTKLNTLFNHIQFALYGNNSNIAPSETTWK